MKEFIPIELGNLIEFQRGFDLPKNEFVSGNIPVISSNGILGYHNEAKVKAPGITIGRSGTVGLPHLIKEDFFPHNTSLFVKDFKGNNIEYIFYLLKSLKLNEYKSGSGVPTMNRNHLHPIKVIATQNIESQTRMAKILSTIDKKITLNNHLNDNLEQQAKVLYDYWFVQNIDEKWETVTLNSFIKNDKSGDWGKETAEGNYIVKVECIRGADINGIIGKGEIKAPMRFILEKNKHKFLSENDLVIEISGGSPTQSTGRLAYVTKEVLERFENPLICSNFCKAISLKDPNELFYFVYSWNKAYENNIFFGFEGKTSGIKNLLFETLVSTYSIVKPDKKTLVEFQNVVSTLEKQRQKNLQQNQQLAALRDWLLPMLMNGQVKIS
ncbi:MAG: restriction endonuclease subunit S [Niabella sp.]